MSMEPALQTPGSSGAAVVFRLRREPTTEPTLVNFDHWPWRHWTVLKLDALALGTRPKGRPPVAVTHHQRVGNFGCNLGIYATPHERRDTACMPALLGLSAMAAHRSRTHRIVGHEFSPHKGITNSERLHACARGTVGRSSFTRNGCIAGLTRALPGIAALGFWLSGLFGFDVGICRCWQVPG